jgi:hypothetical protein
MCTQYICAEWLHSTAYTVRVFYYQYLEAIQIIKQPIECIPLFVMEIRSRRQNINIINKSRTVHVQTRINNIYFIIMSPLVGERGGARRR